MIHLRYIVLILYILYLVRPALPVIDYVLRYDYYVKVLCVNKSEIRNDCCGKCQVVKNITDQTEDNKSSGKSPYPNRVLEVNDVHVKVLFSYLNEDTEITLHQKQCASNIEGNTAKGYNRLPYSPPKQYITA